MAEQDFKVATEAHNKYTKPEDLGDRKLSLLPDTASIEEAQLIEQNDNRNGQFHRSFSPRQVHVSRYIPSCISTLPNLICPQVISLGSNIGSGVFIGTGKALANGGPGSMLIAYGLVCSCVWGVLQTLAEMTIAFPTPGNYIDYADRWVDPALAFGAGFAEWLGRCLSQQTRIETAD